MNMASARLYIYLLMISTVLALCSPAIALEKSSKKNCAICHVMWMDDFRTDKETLIEWQPGNVLMKDTQGVVSSEEMCYSCHDGYVMDSRHKVWKYNRHKTFVKPSNKVTVPKNLPLSNKDEIYCGTCHSAHGGGVDTEGLITTANSFIRIDNVDSSLCEKCHRKEAAFKEYNGHPTKTKSYTIPEILFAAGSKRSKSRNLVICQTCHEVHGAKGRKLTVIDNQGSALCTACHEEQRSLIQTKHDLRVSLPDEKNIREQKPSESGPCGSCHLPHNGSDNWMWAKAPIPGERESQQCLACHSNDSELKIKRIGTHSHPIDIELSAKKPTNTMLPLFLANGSINSSGKVQCFTCHDPHRWDPDNLLNTGGKKIEGDNSNSFLRISNRASSTLCLACHQDKEQLITSDHNLEVTAPDEKNLQELTAGATGPCGACHIPHNASGKRLWAKPLSAEKDFTSQLCAGCHNPNGAAKEKLTGNNSHPVEVVLKNSNTELISGQFAEKLPLYDMFGDQMVNGKVVCVTCHEPHTWDPKQDGPLENYGRKNMEGDEANSFLRMTNLPSPELCKICHLKAAGVEGTAHDLNKTAPEVKNLLGQTVKISGVCGACHLVHKAPFKLKLWARPYGPITENENIMDGLCTSCHSKGNIAEKKIPAIAIHPAKKLLTNIMQRDKKGMNYMPLFDADGREILVGDIACPTCHNAHQWTPSRQETASGNSPKTTSVRTFRFLRNMSYNTFCKDCHGPDAIYRYMYFHEPEIRFKK
jgi:predicted CXXCH cytochrome family protein